MRDLVNFGRAEAERGTLHGVDAGICAYEARAHYAR
jgi:hypothetical protein